MPSSRANFAHVSSSWSNDAIHPATAESAVLSASTVNRGFPSSKKSSIILVDDAHLLLFYWYVVFLKLYVRTPAYKLVEHRHPVWISSEHGRPKCDSLLESSVRVLGDEQHCMRVSFQVA
jgi:hypothetical protein